MRKNLALVLVGLSACLLLIGLMCVTWAPGKVKKTPLDVDSTTHLEGEVAAVQTGGETVPVRATSITKADSEASNDDTIVFVNTSCLVVNEGDPPDCVEADDDRLISASTDTFATDRVNGLATDIDTLPDDDVEHEGIVNKFPFDTEQKTYPYWDAVVGGPVDAVYDRTEDVDGVETYVFVVTIDEVETEIADGVDGVYSSTKEIYVEPLTGAILNQTDDQQRETADGTEVLDLQLAFTEDQQQQSADDARDNISLIRLATRIAPIVGFVGGGILLAAGLFLAFAGRRKGDDGDDVFGDSTTPSTPATV